MQNVKPYYYVTIAKSIPAFIKESLVQGIQGEFKGPVNIVLPKTGIGMQLG